MLTLSVLTSHFRAFLWHSVSKKLKGIACPRKQRNSFSITDRKDDAVLCLMHPRTPLAILASRPHC